MSGTDSIETLRTELSRLEKPLVDALAQRARHKQGVAPGRPTDTLEAAYRDALLPDLCDPGQDGGGSAGRLLDERVLALLRERLAMGARVAQAKSRRDPELYARLALAGDREGLIRALTDLEAEVRVLSRVHALALGAADTAVAERIRGIFERWIIPWTKEAQADSLLGV